jgi:hydrogenase nickel incorporation protein HypA/HybF
MHEFSIAQGIMKIVQERMKDIPKDLLAIHLRIGKLVFIDYDSLRFCFDVISEQTLAKKVQLKIEEIPWQARCNHCKTEFEVPDMLALCPKCKGKDIKTVTGYELEVFELEVE